MNLKFSFLILQFPLIIIAIKTPPEADYYHAAVVEYMPVQGSVPEETLALNAQRYIEIITEVAEKADIVVFPEGSLNNGDLTLFTKVPILEENKTTPLKDGSIHDAIRNISKAAKANSLYVVINIHEEEIKNGSLKYNTNVVFDRNGTIVARYRKYNLYSEKVLNITSEPEHTYFDTDFGVRFGTFTCFDILFKEPPLTLIQNYNVTDIVFTTWWFSELPFLTAVQEQASWSYAADTNLLASGVNAINRGSTGSGIYAGRRGTVVSLQSQQPGTRILTAKIYKKGKKGISTGNIKNFHPIALGNGNLSLKKEYLEDYATELLTPDVNDPSLHKILQPEIKGVFYFIQNFMKEQQLCQNGFCCTFYINMTVTYKNDDFPISLERTFNFEDSFFHYRYRLAVFNGIRSFDHFASGGSQVCGIIPCLNDTFASCGMKTGNAVPLVLDTNENGPIYLYSTIFHNVTIKTSTLALNSYTFPNFLESSESEEQFGSVNNISNIYFSVNGSNSMLSFSSSKLVAGALYTRIYSRDGEPPGVIIPSGSSSLKCTLVLCTFMLILERTVLD